MKLWRWIPKHLRTSTPVLIAFGLVFFIFHRPGPLPAQLSEISWLPQVSCEEAWQGENWGDYDSSQDARPHPELPGNFGYDNYQERILQDYGIRRQDCLKDWTILVYMAANNDLTPFAYWDLYEMEASYPMHRAGSTLVSDLLVDLQTPETPYSQRLHIFQSDKEFDRNKTRDDFLRMNLSEIHSPIVNFDKGDLSPEENLFRFVDWGVRHYPAKNYMLVVWGHGQGWTGDAGESKNLFAGRFGGLAFQEDSTRYLTTPGLARVLQRVEQETFEGQDKIDVYASDACLMQQLEVAYEVADHTRYIVGSAQTQTYLGLPYRRMMYEINRGCYNTRENGHPHCGDNVGLPEKAQPTTQLYRVCGFDEACYLARMLPQLTRQSFSNPEKSLQYPGDPRAINYMTMSSLRAGVLRHGLTRPLQELGKALLHYLRSAPFAEREAFRETLDRTETFYGDARELTITLGLLDEFFKAYPAPDVRQKIHELNAWLDEVVLARAFGKNYFKKKYHLLGVKMVSTWIPSSREVLSHREDDYLQSQLYQDLLWQSDGTNYWYTWIQELYFPSQPQPLQQFF